MSRQIQRNATQIRGVVRAILGSAAAAMCAPLYAQTAPAAGTAAPEDQLQEVVVTGIRASLQKSMEIKKAAVGVVDSISAEDIGQFPDANIGDAIARIPGVTVNRGSLNYSSAAGAPTATGATQGLNVRGFGGSFNEVLLDGRPIASGNGQTFNFGDLSAVYVGEVNVNKTPDMSLSSGTIGATINVKMLNPFDRPGLHAQFFGQGNLHDMDGSVRPGFGALLSNTSPGGEFVGFLVDFDYLDSHIEGHHQDIVGWKGTHLACFHLRRCTKRVGLRSGGYRLRPARAQCRPGIPRTWQCTWRTPIHGARTGGCPCSGIPVMRCS